MARTWAALRMLFAPASSRPSSFASSSLFSISISVIASMWRSRIAANCFWIDSRIEHSLCCFVEAKFCLRWWWRSIAASTPEMRRCFAFAMAVLSASLSVLVISERICWLRSKSMALMALIRSCFNCSIDMFAKSSFLIFNDLLFLTGLPPGIKRDERMRARVLQFFTEKGSLVFMVNCKRTLHFFVFSLLGGARCAFGRRCFKCSR